MIWQLIVAVLMVGASIYLAKSLNWILQWKKKLRRLQRSIIAQSLAPVQLKTIGWLSTGCWIGPLLITWCLEHDTPLQVSAQLLALALQAQQEDSDSNLGRESHVGWWCHGTHGPLTQSPLREGTTQDVYLRAWAPWYHLRILSMMVL